jgi:hypothetical protein
VKYFTPELLARCRSLDEDVAEAADEEWEQAIAAYRQRLQEIRKSLPLGARQLLKHVTLHDAQLLTINRAGKELFLTFRLAGSANKPAGGVELHCTLTRPAELHTHEPQPPNGPTTRWLLYDEFDLPHDRQETGFAHSLLLAGGLELRIAFSRLRIRRFARVLLADSKVSEIEKELVEDQLATA